VYGGTGQPLPPLPTPSVTAQITDYWEETKDGGGAIASCDVPPASRKACVLFELFSLNTSQAVAAQLCEQGKFANCKYDSSAATCYQCKPTRYTGFDFSAKAVEVCDCGCRVMCAMRQLVSHTPSSQLPFSMFTPLNRIFCCRRSSTPTQPSEPALQCSCIWQCTTHMRQCRRLLSSPQCTTSAKRGATTFTGW
jgi:hypothetical protein